MEFGGNTPAAYDWETDEVLDRQVAALDADYRAAIAGATGDYGPELIDAGGWTEIAQATVELAAADITNAAKIEWLRRQGLAEYSWAARYDDAAAPVTAARPAYFDDDIEDWVWR